MGQQGGHAQWKTSGAVAVVLTRLFLFENTFGEFEFRLTGPADASLAYNDHDELEVDPDGTDIIALNGSGDLITFEG